MVDEYDYAFIAFFLAQDSISTDQDTKAWGNALHEAVAVDRGFLHPEGIIVVDFNRMRLITSMFQGMVTDCEPIAKWFCDLLNEEYTESSNHSAFSSKKGSDWTYVVRCAVLHWSPFLDF